MNILFKKSEMQQVLKEIGKDFDNNESIIDKFSSTYQEQDVMLPDDFETHFTGMAGEITCISYKLNGVSIPVSVLEDVEGFHVSDSEVIIEEILNDLSLKNKFKELSVLLKGKLSYEYCDLFADLFKTRSIWNGLDIIDLNALRFIVFKNNDNSIK